MSNNERGTLTVEASIGLVLFTLFVLFLFSFARVYRAQNMVSHAALQSADNIAMESYLRELAVEGDAEDIIYLASLLSESSSLTVEDLESLRTVNLPKLAQERFTSAISNTTEEADSRLQELGVKDGLAGIDFSASTMDLQSNDVIVAVQYTIKMQFPILGATELAVSKTAKAKTFGEVLYSITTGANEPSWGSTSGDGKVSEGDTVIITATPYYGYEFVSWDDGVTDNPREVLVSEAQHYTAIFAPIGNGINLSINNGAYGVYDNEYGTVTGAGVYDYMSTATITAQAKEHYTFVGWDDNGDGNVDNTSATRTIVMEQVDQVYFFSAIFKPGTFTITVQSNNPEYGTAIAACNGGSGTSVTAEYGSTVQLIASPTDTVRYAFDHWSNNRTQMTTTVTVTGNATYTAYFGPNCYNVKFYVDNVSVATVKVMRGSSIAGSAPYLSASMPADPTKSTATFDTWKYNGAKFTATTIVNSDISVHAFWKYNVTFDAAGGFVQGAGSKTITAYQGVPVNLSNYTPTRYGYSFVGWFDGSTQYSGSKEFTAHTTLTAQWTCTHPEREERPDPNYSECSGGTISYYCTVCGAYLGSTTVPGIGAHVWGRCQIWHRVSYFRGYGSGGCGNYHAPGWMRCFVCVNCKRHRWDSNWQRVGGKSWWCAIDESGHTTVEPIDGHYYYNMDNQTNW